MTKCTRSTTVQCICVAFVLYFYCICLVEDSRSYKTPCPVLHKELGSSKRQLRRAERGWRGRRRRQLPDTPPSWRLPPTGQPRPWVWHVTSGVGGRCRRQCPHDTIVNVYKYINFISDKKVHKI